MTCSGIVPLRSLGTFKVGLLLFTLSVQSTSAQSQAILGTLVEAETGAPIEGAAIILLSESGDQLSWRLTDTAGRFSFPINRSGRFQLRADRIGHASVLTDIIALDGAKNAVQRIEAPLEAILLSGLEVESNRRCEIRPEDGVATARVWEEARKALEAASQTTRRGTYRYVLRRYVRELDARGRRVQEEDSRILRQVLRRPFNSLDVDDLLSQGFVRPEGDGSVYYAPDADVLLSDPFLDTHCMNLTKGRDEEAGLLGLAFKPTKNRGVVEISGVLWLDAQGGHLQSLDYGYEYLDVPNAERLGGHLKFEGLPNGTWIISDWSIRMPILTGTVLDGGRQRIVLAAIREEGGQVVRVNNLQGDLVLDYRSGTIEGVVLDSLDVEPVEGATVLLDESMQTKTDDEGRFRFTSLTQGRYGVSAVNPALDSFGLAPPPVYVDAIPGEVVSVRLQSSGLMASLVALCQQPEVAEGNLGVLVGYVHDASGNPAIGSNIKISWQEIVRSTTGRFGLDEVFTSQDWESNLTVERTDGFYWACGIPRGASVDVVVTLGDVESEPLRFRFPEMEIVTRQDVVVPSGG